MVAVDNRDAETNISISGPVITVSVMSNTSPSVRQNADLATASFVDARSAASAVGAASIVIPAVAVGSLLPTTNNPYKVGRHDLP